MARYATYSVRYCAGCMTAISEHGLCTKPSCSWKDALQPETQEHLPRHYMLLERYYIGRALGQGGFGVTYLARDLRLDRLVAIKEYLPRDQCSRRADRTTVHSFSGEKSDEFRYGLATFLNEARNVARLGGHPNIVTITDYAEANGTAYMVMEYIPGITLKQYLLEHGKKIPYHLASEIVLHTMAGLMRTHEAGLIHRDVSPDNVLLSSLGPVKLIDFGAARQAIGEKSQNLTMVLKPGYAPEEQYRSKGVQGPWTDVYATAATLYRCVTGQVPPAAPDRLAEDELIRPSSLCQDISETAEAALLMALTVRAQGRFQTIRAFQQALVGQQAATTPLTDRGHTPLPQPQKELKTIVDMPATGSEKPVPAPNPQLFGTAQPSESPAYRPVTLFAPRAVWLATFFGTPVAGASLMAINYKRLGRTGAAWKAFLIGLGVTMIVLIAAGVAPDTEVWKSLFMGVSIGLSFAMSGTAKHLQGKVIEENHARGGSSGSYWAAFGVGLVGIVFSVAVIVGSAYAKMLSETSIPVGSNDKIVYSSPATKADAEELAQVLKSNGFFQDRGVEVDLTRRGTIPVISFILADGRWNEPKVQSDFEQVGRLVAPALGGFPIEVRLMNTSKEVEKTITLQPESSNRAVPQTGSSGGNGQTDSASVLNWLSRAQQSNTSPQSLQVKANQVQYEKGEIDYWDPVTRAQAVGFYRNLGIDLFGSPGPRIGIRRSDAETQVDFVLSDKGAVDFVRNLKAPDLTKICQGLGGLAALTIGGLPIRLRAFDASGQTMVERRLDNSMTGTVTDAAGAVVSAAKVSLASDAMKERVKFELNDAGGFGLAGLKAGGYTLTVEAQGFKPYSRMVSLESSEAARLNVVMQVGAD